MTDAELRSQTVPRADGLVSGRALLMLWGPVAAVTLAHYSVGPEMHWVHDVLRRLYYIPIVLGAFYFGRRGALAVSLVTSLLYLPHAFGHMERPDPGPSVEKLLEIGLYNIIALITGTLADREHRERLNQERIATRLAESVEERRLMEMELVRAGKLQALGELTAGLAHELRNPLASIKGAVEIVSDEVAMESPRRRMVDILHKEIDRLTTLLDRFLAFARPQPSRLDDVRLNDVVEHVLGILVHQAKHGGVELRWQGATPSLEVRADREQLSAVLMNILLNAMQAMPDGGDVEISAKHATRGHKEYCVLTIADTGPGVPDELKDKIFNPFVTTKPAGTGFGLSIASRVVEAHAGSIQVTDREGGGAVFSVWLPRATSALQNRDSGPRLAGGARV